MPVYSNWPLGKSLEILPTDRLFGDSPDVGDPACLCSRCGEPILEGDAPSVRVWPDSGSLVVGQPDEEYRFHARCLLDAPEVPDVAVVVDRETGVIVAIENESDMSEPGRH